MKENGNMELTCRQSRFVEEYLLDLNATQAAVRSGYSPRGAAACGWNLLRKPAVQRAVACAMEERSRRVQIDQDLVVQGLWSIAVGGTGRERMRALELLGRHLGMWRDGFEGTGS